MASHPSCFDDVHPVGKSNRKLCLSQYIEEQMVRNQTAGQDKKTSMCQCHARTTYMSKNLQTRLFAPEDNADKDENDKNDNSKDHVNMRNLPVVPAVPPFFMQPPSTAAFFVPPASHLQKWHMAVGCDGHMIAATCWLAITIVQRTLCIFAESALACKSGKPPHERTSPVRRHLQR